MKQIREKKPVFQNRENNVYTVENKQIWESRSVAVVGILFALVNKKLYVLAEKRSDTIADEPGKWCLPCGYLDWNESGWDALRREVYEETSFLLDDYEEFLVHDNGKNPFFVNTSPSENRQNVALSYSLVFEFHNEEEFPKHIENHVDHEVSEIKWLPYDERHSLTWAFNHNHRINMALDHILDIID